MLHDAALASLHHLAAFSLVGLLMAEWALLRGAPSAEVVKRIARIDLAYGIAAGLLIVVGVGRVMHGAKGAAFYLGNPFFWAKMGLFAAVGVLSIVPTLRYIKWRKQPEGPTAQAWAAMRRFVIVQLHLLAGVMICAALMARGIGS